VEFFRDPFPLMGDPAMLYIGSEHWLNSNQPWMVKRMMETYGEVTDPDKQLLNPGIVGGTYARMLTFLDQWLEEMGKAIQPGPPPPHDIVAFNRLIYREKIPFVTGAPLHTRFRHNEGPESECAIRHK